MRVAIIGSSGAGIGGLLARAGHEVVFSGSRDPQRLAHAAELAGPKARTASVGDAVDQAEVVVMAVPFERYPDVAREVGEALRGKVVVDTSNPIDVRHGQVEFLDVPDGLTAAQHQRSRLGNVRLVKAFNMLCPSSILELAPRTGDDRVAVPFVGDDPAAKEMVAGLIEDAGFAPVDAGGLVDARALDPNSADDPRWGTGLTEREARALVEGRLTANRSGQEEWRADGAA